MSLNPRVPGLAGILLLAIAAAGWWAPAPCRADAEIWVKAANPWSVTGKDDLQQLKYLASGVGWEFEPTDDTTAGLRRLGIKTIRCINVDVIGAFNKDGKYIVEKGNGRLEAHLDACRNLGAVPHIIIAQGVPEELRLKEADVAEPLKEAVRKGAYGPTDWAKFRSYCEAYYEYVLVTRGFPNAEFEVANEPDIGGGIIPMPPRPAMGSRALYEAAFNLYKNAAEAAVAVEGRHPGMKVKVGGLALSWAFTFKFGDFNWVEKFIRDCSEQKVKLDFLGVHFYGNIASLDGEYPTIYPSFTGMMRVAQAAIDKYLPGLPVYFTEWGPSYVTSTTEAGAVNANHVGAAWAAAYLNTMLTCRVEEALFLVTTDLRQQDAAGTWTDNWGWDALYLDPPVFGGKAYPKPIYHVFDMVSRMAGKRVEATRGSESVNDIVSADPDTRKITMLVWNYNAVIPEGGAYQSSTAAEKTRVRVRDAGDFFKGKQVRVETWQVNENAGNVYKLLTTGVAPTEANTAMAQLPATSAKLDKGMLDFSVTLPASSVSLLVLSEAP